MTEEQQPDPRAWLEWKYQETRVRILELLAEMHAQRMRRDLRGAERAYEQAMRLNPFFLLSIMAKMKGRLMPTPADPAWSAHMDQERAKLEELRTAGIPPAG